MLAEEMSAGSLSFEKPFLCVLASAGLKNRSIIVKKYREMEFRPIEAGVQPVNRRPIPLLLAELSTGLSRLAVFA